jgi:energy-coupling factor transporter transmembrane protein EcfT
MQDPRIRIFVIIVLSVAAFISMAGAALAFLYWICLPGRFQCIKRPAAVLFLSMIIVVSVITEITTGNGLSYFIRMTVILLLALYAYTASVPGEFFRVSVWLFGPRGFDPGLIAEMSMGALNDLEDDSSKIRIALRQKGVPLGLSTIIPVIGMFVLNQIRRAHDQADLLTVRGYRNGGTLCPQFHPEILDYVSGIVAICMLFIAILPVRDIFILLH